MQKNALNDSSKKIIRLIEVAGLMVIALSTVVAFVIEVLLMIKNQHVGLPDLLLMFIYLEVLAMVAVYLNSGKLPVRMPLYIAIVALARYVILDMKNFDEWRLLAVAGAIFLITLATLVIRYGHTHYPYNNERGKQID